MICFFPWNVVRVCVSRYFSSSTSLAHLYNFAAICCFLKQNKSLSFKINAGCQSGTVLLPGRRPAFGRIFCLAWASCLVCWVRPRLKFFIPPGLYSEKAKTAQYLYIFWGDEKESYPVLFVILNELRLYTLPSGCMNTFSIPTPLLLWAAKRTVNTAAFLEKRMFSRCETKGSKNTGFSIVMGIIYPVMSKESWS